ncbi:MAG: AraC family transcriptional regulator [Verrucomicrobiae bacterium]|nr:AraC family transcriptional regulator [Verrucomicrobiae bacterium]
MFSSDKISVLGMHHHASSVGVIVMKPDYFSFMWWDGNEECRINGKLARSTEIYAQGEQDGFYAAGGARQTMGIAVRRSELIATLAALQGVGPEDVQLDRTVLQLSAKAAGRFRSSIGTLLGNAFEPGPDGFRSRIAGDPSEAIFGLLVDAYLGSPPNQLREDRPRRPEKIVRQAEECFFAAQGAPVSLADLCAAASVSQSSLYRAFSAVCGEPPLAYFHKRQLTDARRRLVHLPAYRGAVKFAALSAGLSELGRFSVEYRTLFGESPSSTLGRKPPNSSVSSPRSNR